MRETKRQTQQEIGRKVMFGTVTHEEEVMLSSGVEENLSRALSGTYFTPKI